MKKVIGIDIGGTMTSIAVMDDNFGISSKIDFPTPREPEGLVEKTIEVVNKIDPNKELSCGMAICGLLSHDGKKLYFAPNLNWENLDLQDLFKGLNREFTAVNDGSAAAWGCYISEGIEKSTNLLSITMGTGVGGGIVINGSLLFSAAEIGHIKLDQNGPLCGCGSKGCLEAYIGGRHIPARTREWTGLDVSSAEKLFNLAKQGEKKAIESWKQIGFIAGYALSGVVNLNGIQKIVLGGTVASYAGRFFLETMKKTLKENLMAMRYQDCEIIISNWKKDMSLLGAAAIMLVHPVNMNECRLIKKL